MFSIPYKTSWQRKHVYRLQKKNKYDTVPINYTLFLVSNDKLAVEASAISNQNYFKNFLNESDSYESTLKKKTRQSKLYGF